MQDTYNLAWKLALVLRGRAGDALLDSYDAERQPVGRQVVERANQSVDEMVGWFTALGLRPDMTPDEADARLAELYGPDGEPQRAALLAALDVTNAQFNAHGVELGQRYRSRAVAHDGAPPPEPTRDPVLHYEPSTYPGSPVPHAWLAVGDRDVSTLDLCAYDRFTLVTGASGQPWLDAAAKVSAELGVEIAAVPVSLGLDTNDVYGDWTRRREVGDRGCVLVRPDRIVAWRAPDRVDDPQEALQAVMSDILALGGRA
jgi:2,4-dichlorophenol 6-monooxygenase